MNRLSCLILFFFLITGCGEGAKQLNFKLKSDNVCVYINDKSLESPKRIYLYMGEINSKKPFETSYDRLYESVAIPTSDKNCIMIPRQEFKVNVGYIVTLDTGSIFNARICMVKKGNLIEIAELKNDDNKCY